MLAPTEDEAARLRALRALSILDTERVEAFDRIARLTARLLEAPIALISFVDESRQWVKASVGLDLRSVPRQHAFCARAIRSRELHEVEDVSSYADSPLVERGCRFYAGAPLVIGGGAVGTLSILDREPRSLDDGQRRMLRDLAGIVVDELALRRTRLQSERRLELLEIAEEVAALGHWSLAGDETERWSTHMFQLLGVRSHVPPQLRARVHPDDATKLDAAIGQARELGDAFDLTLRVLRGDGEGRNVRLVGRAALEHDEQMLFGVVRDLGGPRVSPRREVVPGRVLIIDDELFVGRALARLLHTHDCVVETDARRALMAIERGPRPDAILCDLMMPGMDGEAFYEALRAKHPELAERVVFVTGGAFTLEARAFLATTERPVLDKPVDAGALRAHVARLVAQSEMD